MEDREGRPQIVLDPTDPLAEGFSSGTPLGAERLTVAPLFYADDPDARVVGRLVDTSRPGLVVKKQDGWTSIYSGAMQLPQGLMRNMARAAEFVSPVARQSLHLTARTVASGAAGDQNSWWVVP